MRDTSQEYTSELLRVTCQGAVQGQGFRPKIARAADILDIPGCVFNDLAGVSLFVKVTTDQKTRLLDRLAQLFDDSVTIQVSPYQPNSLAGHAEVFQQALMDHAFTIAESAAGDRGFDIPKDIGICKRCEEELHKPNHVRRYQHILNACAECGPRYSLIKDVPFDRGNTALAAFGMCKDCQVEYTDQSDRRFHSQLNHCKNCGPEYWLQDSSGKRLNYSSERLVDKACNVLLHGGIVAIKNMGGFHLCCLADEVAPVKRLRALKHRPEKPFAIMATLSQAKQIAVIDDASERCLESSARPIVIVPYQKDAAEKCMSGVAPGLNRVGIMLPSTALQVLLLEKLKRVVVMTSANVSGGALAVDQTELEAMAGSIDLFILNNRVIENPIDDAVFSSGPLGLQLIRHGRGIAPSVINVEKDSNLQLSSKQILAMGGELKNSFAMSRKGIIYLSPFNGDLHDANVLQRYQNQCEKDLQRFQCKPDVIAIDAHPDYHSSQWGRELAEAHQAKLVQVQHHHAHSVACMVEHGLLLNESVYAWVLDGFGWGDDNSLWGGELLQVTAKQYQRVGGIKPFLIVGGNLSAKQPWRNSLSLIQSLSLGEQQNLVHHLSPVQSAGALMEGVLRCLHQQANTVPTSSAGRLFDGVAALLGFPEKEISYEGQAAIWLQQQAESYLEQCDDTEMSFEGINQYLQLEENNQQIQISSQLWLASLVGGDANDRDRVAEKAYQFHYWLAHSLVACLLRVRVAQGDSALDKKVVLCGGVMQNQLLLTLLHQALIAKGFIVFLPQKIPTSDGGIALGQAAIAAAQVESSNLCP